VRQRTEIDGFSKWPINSEKEVSGIQCSACVPNLWCYVRWVEKEKIRLFSFIVAKTSARRSLSTPSPFSLGIDFSMRLKAAVIKLAETNFNGQALKLSVLNVEVTRF